MRLETWTKLCSFQKDESQVRTGTAGGVACTGIDEMKLGTSCRLAGNVLEAVARGEPFNRAVELIGDILCQALRPEEE